MFVVARTSRSRGLSFAGQSTTGRPIVFTTEKEAADEATRRANARQGQEWMVFGVIGQADVRPVATYKAAEGRTAPCEGDC